MPNTRRNFTAGVMNMDTDERLLPDGMVRRADCVDIVHAEGSDVGAVRNRLSNKVLTNLSLGANIEEQGVFCDEFEKKLYWLVLSDSGSYLIEWDSISNTTAFVLKDTRPLATRVFSLKRGNFCTGMNKIINSDPLRNLFLMSDDNMPPLCINIARAKAYGENGFEKEDIWLIKKPPRYAPSVSLTYDGVLNNNLEERFLLFAYRYKYLDQEFSATSSFTNYKFYPKPFNLDFFTMENLGMVNNYSAARIKFNTGDKRVTDVQLIVKESGSNALYIVETFNKEKEGWNNDEIRNFTFSNNKTYMPLPMDELAKSFDNVPLLAKAQTIIENTPIYGNFLEGYDIVDADNNEIKIDFSVALKTNNLNQVEDFETTIQSDIDSGNLLIVNDPELILTEGKRLVFYISIQQLTTQTFVYSNSFYYILPADYATMGAVFASDEFISFMSTVNADYQLASNLSDIPPGWAIQTPSQILSSVVGSSGQISVTQAVFEDTNNGSALEYVNLTFSDGTLVSLSELTSNATLKTNRDFEVSLIYQDEFGRETTALTCPNNTIYIPQDYSAFQNRLLISINNPPPVFADRYKIAVKTQPLTYETIIVNKYYNEDLYVWCKLEGDNKDKVREGDILIVKRTATITQSSIIKVKVLDIKEKEKDFIENNVNDDGVDIIEEAGLYMRIKPVSFSMDEADYQILQDERGDIGSNNFPTTFMSLFTVTDSGGNVTGELAIPQGSSISIFINSSRDTDQGWRNNTYNKEFFSQRNYETLQEFFEENILHRPLFGNEGNATENYQNNISLIRGNLETSSGLIAVDPDPNGKLYLKIIGTKSGGSKNRKGYVRFKITVRTSEGFFVFETEPKKQADLNVFYKTEQTFDIVNGQHTGNLQNQILAISQPAKIDLDFYNCFAQGNGIESYKIKDSFNKNALNIDTRPTAVSLNSYQAVRRFADLTHGEPYVESTNINGLSVFNLSNMNFRELDKQYGSIQRLHSRDTDIVVLQEDKASKVLFNKTMLYNADGTTNLADSEDSENRLLGKQITYLGENGIGKNPESLAINDYQMYYVTPRRGVVQRLSMDGLTSITNWMEDYFRDLFIANPTSRKLGGYDPYHKQFVLSVADEPQRLLQVNCSNQLIKSNQTEAFSYNLKLNDLGGDIIIQYNITSGNATITAVFDGEIHVASNVNGIGTLAFERSSLVENIVLVTIVPVSSSISYEIINLCPVGSELKIVNVVLNDAADISKTIINRHKWNTSSFYESDDLFDNIPVSRFDTETGLEGVGKFPLNGSVVTIQSLKNTITTGNFEPENCNKIGYLVSSVVYNEGDTETILQNATFISLTESGELGFNEVFSGNFLFNRSNTNQILYLIWDYTSRNPILSNDFATTMISGSVVIDILENDEISNSATVTIQTPPMYGNAILNPNKTITYTHDGSENYADTVEYKVTQNGCSSTAFVNISIGNPCSGGINANGNQGIYETIINVGTDLGYTGIEFNAQSVPDRFQLYYNDVLVGDSKYVGDSLVGNPPTYPGLLGPKTLSVLSYNGSEFVATGETRNIDIIQSDIANGTTESTNGNGLLYFNKTTANPSTIKIVVTGPTASTAWNMWGICPQEEIPEMQHNN